MDVLNYLSANATGLTLAFNIIIFILMLYLNTKYAPKSLEAIVRTLETRVTLVEKSIAALPSEGDLHKLSNSITELNGKIQSLEVKLEGAQDLIERVEAQSNRIDHYLRTAK